MEKILDPGDIIWIRKKQGSGNAGERKVPFVVVSSRDYNSSSGKLLVCPVVWGDETGEFRVSIPEPCDVRGVVILDRVTRIDPRRVNAVFALSCPAETTRRITTALRKLFK